MVGAGRIRGLLARKEVREQIERFRRFYGPTLPDGTVAYFSLQYRPQRVKASSSGRQISNVGMVEFFAAEKPESRIDIVLHEFCHFLYDSRPDEANLALQRRFLAVGDSVAKPALNLLNEGMASAFGNGVITRLMTPAEQWKAYAAKPLSFYNNPAIDRAGKRGLRLVDEWLPEGRTMDDPAFAATYVAALKEEFGSELTKPILFLNEAFIYVDERFGRPFMRELRQTLGVASAYTQMANRVTAQALGELKSQPNISAIIVVPPGQVDALVAEGVLTAADAAAIRGEIAERKGALYAVQRSPMAYAFVIVTDDAAEASQWAALISKAPAFTAGLMR